MGNGLWDGSSAMSAADAPEQIVQCVAHSEKEQVSCATHQAGHELNDGDGGEGGAGDGGGVGNGGGGEGGAGDGLGGKGNRGNGDGVTGKGEARGNGGVGSEEGGVRKRDS